MLARRLIPVLFIMDGYMVRSETFDTHNVIGGPVEHVQRMVEWDVDELIVIDISRGAATRWEFPRDDLRRKPPRTMLDFVRMIAVECRIPLTFGGRIRTLSDIAERIQNGADKVALNSILALDPEVVDAAAKRFGSQALVLGCDYRLVDGVPYVLIENGTRETGRVLWDWIQEGIDRGVGEIFLQSVEQDGRARGYDLDTISAVCDRVSVPVIACSGAGHQRHFLKCFEETDASAVAAGNIFHFTENAYPRAKTYLRDKGVNIR